MIPILFFTTLFLQITAFHFYVDASEVKCFTEDMGEDFRITGYYKMLIMDSVTGLFKEDIKSTMKITVFALGSDHQVVDTTGSSKGKFTFNAAESSLHQICLTPFAPGWYTTKAKVYFEMKYTDEEEETPDSKSEDFKVTSKMAKSVGQTIRAIRSDINAQREIEHEVRELSEAVNSRTYQFTLIQIFILVLTSVWQLNSLKTFFQTKKLV